MLDRIESSQTQLRASERRYAELFKCIEMLSVMMDTHGCITHCNDHLLRVTGWQRNEILGNRFDRFLVAGDSKSRAAFTKAMASGRIAAWTEGRMRTRDGGVLTVRWHNSLIHAADETVAGLAALGEDVTAARDGQFGRASCRERV